MKILAHPCSVATHEFNQRNTKHSQVMRTQNIHTYEKYAIIERMINALIKNTINQEELSEQYRNRTT